MLYFDCAATYSPYPETLQAFLDATAKTFGNSASSHAFGREASKALEEARLSILRDLGVAKTHQLIFTSGASESNNMALKSVALHYQNRGKKILVSSVEHASVLQTARDLHRLFGFEVIELPVSKEGVVTPEILSSYMDESVILVSIMAVNNETGAIFPISELAKVVHAYPKAFFHSDLTQAIGKAKIDFSCLDLGSFSGHKFGGLKGTGGLFYKKTMLFDPLVSGGSQEFGIRGGTVNVPGDCSLAVALGKSIAEFDEHQATMKELTGYLKKRLSPIAELEFHSPANATPYVLNFSFGEHKASVVVEALSERGIYVSSVSACNSKEEPSSYVLSAMGVSPRRAANSLRVSMPLSTTKEEIDAFVAALKTILSEVRPL